MGLEEADYAAIALGTLLFLFLLGIVVVVVLMKKGYIGRKVSPSTEIADDKPKLISNFSRSGDSLYSESIGPVHHSTPEYKPGPEANPIIYLYDDIYYPPNTRPLPNRRIEKEKPARQKKNRKEKEEKLRKQSENKPHLRKSEPNITKTDDYGDDDIVVIADTGNKVYTRYGLQAPYQESSNISHQNSYFVK